VTATTALVVRTWDIVLLPLNVMIVVVTWRVSLVVCKVIDAEVMLIEVLEKGLRELETELVVEVAEDTEIGVEKIGVEKIGLVSEVVVVGIEDATDWLLTEAIELDDTIDCIEDKGVDCADGDTTEAITDEAESPREPLCRRSNAIAALAPVSEPKRRLAIKKN
jgi:hypothetical protein